MTFFPFCAFQVDVIFYIESMLLGDPFNLLANWPAFIWLRRLPACSLGNTLYRIPPLRKFFHKVTGAAGILLFYDFLPSKTVTFYPNHDPVLCGCLGGGGNAGDENVIVDFHPSILEATKNVFLEKIQAENAAEERLARAESLLESLKEENRSLTSKVDQILGILSSKKS